MLQRTWPEVGQSTPPKILIKVDLPWPLRPRTAKRPSGGRSNDRSLNKRRTAPWPTDCFDKPLTVSMSGSAGFD